MARRRRKVSRRRMSRRRRAGRLRKAKAGQSLNLIDVKLRKAAKAASAAGNPALLIRVVALYKPEVLKKLYDIDANPLRAWLTYKLTRATRSKLPVWVLKYLDRVADNLSALL